MELILVKCPRKPPKGLFLVAATALSHPQPKGFLKQERFWNSLFIYNMMWFH